MNLNDKPVELWLAEDDYWALVALLEEPDRPMPRLAALLRSQAPWDEGTDI